MGHANGLHDGQPQSRTAHLAGARFIHAKKAIENVRQGGSGNTNSVVRYFKEPFAIARENVDFNSAPSRRELDGIVQQVDDNLLQTGAVPFHNHLLRTMAGDGNSFVFDEETHLVGSAFSELTQVKGN